MFISRVQYSTNVPPRKDMRIINVSCYKKQRSTSHVKRCFPFIQFIFTLTFFPQNAMP